MLSHLSITRALLASWGCDEMSCNAGLCHAVYGCQGYPALLCSPSRFVVSRHTYMHDTLIGFWLLV